MKKVYLIAAILAVIAGILLYIYMEKLEARYRENYTQVVVASVTIPENTEITPEMVRILEIPSEGIHQTTAKSIDSVAGGVTSQKIYEGEQLLLSKIKKAGESSGKVSYSIPEGMRAITIGVDTISGISGFIRAMDKVDIILITMKEEGGVSKETASILLENIEVLAIGTNPDSRKEDYKPSEPVGVITLLTTPEEALKISLAGTVGRLSLLLRSPADQADMSVRDVNRDNLYY